MEKLDCHSDWERVCESVVVLKGDVLSIVSILLLPPPDPNGLRGSLRKVLMSVGRFWLLESWKVKSST